MNSSNHSLDLVKNPDLGNVKQNVKTLESTQKPYGAISLKKKLINVYNNQKNIDFNPGFESDRNPLLINQESKGNITIKKLDQSSPYSKLEKVKLKIKTKKDLLSKEKISNKKVDALFDGIYESKYEHKLKPKDLNYDATNFELEELKATLKIPNDNETKGLLNKDLSLPKELGVICPFITEDNKVSPLIIKGFDHDLVENRDIPVDPPKSAIVPFLKVIETFDIDAELNNEINYVCQSNTLLSVELENQIVEDLNPNDSQSAILREPPQPETPQVYDFNYLSEKPYFPKTPNEPDHHSILKPKQVINEQEFCLASPKIETFKNMLQNFKNSDTSAPIEIQEASKRPSFRILSKPNRSLSLSKPVRQATSSSYSPLGISRIDSLLIHPLRPTNKSLDIQNPKASSNAMQSPLFPRHMSESLTKTTDFESERSNIASRESGPFTYNFNDSKQEILSHLFIETSKGYKKRYHQDINLHEIEENNVDVAEEGCNEHLAIKENATNHQLLPNIYEKNLKPDNPFIHLDIEHFSCSSSRKSEEDLVPPYNIHIGVSQESMNEGSKDENISNEIEIEEPYYNEHIGIPENSRSEDYMNLHFEELRDKVEIQMNIFEENNQEITTRRSTLKGFDQKIHLQRVKIVKSIRVICLLIIIRASISPFANINSPWLLLLNIFELAGILAAYHMQIIWCLIYVTYLYVDIFARVAAISLLFQSTLNDTYYKPVICWPILICVNLIAIRMILVLISKLGKLRNGNYIIKIKEFFTFCKQSNDIPEN